MRHFECGIALRYPAYADASCNRGSCRSPANDRAGLERLCRYVRRPPLAHDHVQLRADGRVLVQLKTAGTTVRPIWYSSRSSCWRSLPRSHRGPRSIC
jgi:Putative transposase